jgi:hypothetical protein
VSDKRTAWAPTRIQNPEPTWRAITRIRNAREYVLNVLDGERVRANLPYFKVCDSCSYLNAYRFYMNDTTDSDRRRIFWSTRFKALKERERAHVNKFIVDNLPSTILTQLGIAEFGYTLEDVTISDITGRRYTTALRKRTIGTNFDNGDSVRIIGLESNTPILACISCTGYIRDINEDGNSFVIEVNSGQPNQLRDHPVMLLKTDVDLTKRELGSIDFIHRNRGRRQEIALAILGEK